MQIRTGLDGFTHMVVKKRHPLPRPKLRSRITRHFLGVLLSIAPPGAAAFGQDAHEHDYGAAHERQDAARHRPGDAQQHVGHAHPGVDLSHPLVIESPLPESKLRLNYGFADAGDGAEHVAELEAEYAITRTFSFEAVLPYALLDPDEGPGQDHFGDAVVAFKLASYAWVGRSVMPAVGVEVVLPTGDEERGIGSDHVLELEPFLRLGAWSGPFEFIGSFGVGFPVNQTDEESDEEDLALAYGVSALYHAAPRLQALVELHGDSVFGADDAHALYVSPGLTVQPLNDKSINLGAGVTLPLTDEREFDYAINLMWILHF
jgi:hypothetical protein